MNTLVIGRRWAARARAVGCAMALLSCAGALTGCAGNRFWSRANAAGKPDSQALSNIPRAKPKGWLGSERLPWSKSKIAARQAAQGNSGALSSTPSEGELREGQLNVARLSERRGQNDQAEKFYRGLIAKDPNLVDPHHRLGVMMARKAKYEEAEEHLQAALALDPDNIDIISDWGYLRYLQGDHEEAEQAFRHVLDVNSEHASTCNNLATLLAETGRPDEALELFLQVNKEAEAHANLAFALAQAGDIPAAKQHYHAALSLDKNMKSAAVALIQLADRERQQERLAARAKRQQAAGGDAPDANRVSQASANEEMGDEQDNPAQRAVAALAEVVEGRELVPRKVPISPRSSRRKSPGENAGQPSPRGDFGAAPRGSSASTSGNAVTPEASAPARRRESLALQRSPNDAATREIAPATAEYGDTESNTADSEDAMSEGAPIVDSAALVQQAVGTALPGANGAKAKLNPVRGALFDSPANRQGTTDAVYPHARPTWIPQMNQQEEQP